MTELGRSQAAKIPSSPLGAYANANAQVLVTSPLRRTLQTTLIGFRPALTRVPPVPTVALAHLQECNDHPCDTGSSKAELEADPELKLFDFSGLSDDWNGKQGIYAANDAAWTERSRYARRWIRSRPEEVIVVTGHGDMLRWLTLGRNDFSVRPVLALVATSELTTRVSRGPTRRSGALNSQTATTRKMRQPCSGPSPQSKQCNRPCFIAQAERMPLLSSSAAWTGSDPTAPRTPR